MQNDDEALLSISLAFHGQLVKILITLEPHGIFSLNFAYLSILWLSSLKNYIILDNKKNVSINQS